MNLYEEFRRLIDALNEAGVEYAVCGGIAVAFYGFPRFTEDIDLLVLAVYEWRGGRIQIVSPQGLATLKKLANRDQDQVDLKRLGLELSSDESD